MEIPGGGSVAVGVFGRKSGARRQPGNVAIDAYHVGIELKNSFVIYVMWNDDDPSLAEIREALPAEIPLPDVPTNSVTAHSHGFELTWNGELDTVEHYVQELTDAGWEEESPQSGSIGFTEYTGTFDNWEVVVYDFGDGRFVTIFDVSGIRYRPDNQARHRAGTSERGQLRATPSPVTFPTSSWRLVQGSNSMAALNCGRDDTRRVRHDRLDVRARGRPVGCVLAHR